MAGSFRNIFYGVDVPRKGSVTSCSQYEIWYRDVANAKKSRPLIIELYGVSVPTQRWRDYYMKRHESSQEEVNGKGKRRETGFGT